MANADDIISLCNQALYLLGAKTITALDQGTKEANLCNNLYDFNRRNLLRSHLWNFAIMRGELAEYNLLLNGNMEDGSLTTLSDWTAASDATLHRHSTAPYAGTYCMEINGGSLANPYAYQHKATIREFEQLSFDVHVKAGTEATYKIQIYDVTNGVYINDDYDTENEATTSWAAIDTIDFDVPKDCEAIRVILMQIAAGAAGTTIFFDNAKLTYNQWGYEYGYELPGACLRVIQMEDLSYEFKIERGILFTDESECKIMYIYDEETVATFDKLFYDALVAKLAWDMAWPLTHSNTFTETAAKRFELTIGQAKSIDGQEGTPPEFEADTWLDAR